MTSSCSDGDGPGDRSSTGSGSWAGIRASWLPVAIYCAIIVALSSIPGRAVPLTDLLRHDKLIHAVEYAILGGLLARALVRGPPRVSALIALALGAIIATSMGMADELYQRFTPGRMSSRWDVVADAFGGTVGALVVVLWMVRQRRRRSADSSTASGR